jgi:putative hydrolase of the HAD superfamily
MILVFDLDDTLYEEITYVKSSFRAVANYLAKKFNLSVNDIYQELIKVLEQKGRGNVFNEVLLNFHIFSKTEVKNCLTVYRKNQPDIKLSKDAKDCLERFNSFPKYLVTDGNKIVQTVKIKTLGLDYYFKKTIPSHNFGKLRAKPSTYIFYKILDWEQAKPEELVYIGDNPNKDFINLKKEGFKTLRVLKGNFKNIQLTNEYEAHFQINSLDEFDFQLLNKIKKLKI